MRFVLRKFIYLKIYLILILSILTLFACTHDLPNKKIIIAISKGSGSEHYEQYAKWLKSIDSNIICVDLYFKSNKEAMDIISRADGILLTGGPDIHPLRYGKNEDTNRCEIDLKRDSLEFTIIDSALKKKIPIFGICRGLQILNVALGGSLIVDIPEDFGKRIKHRSDDGNICTHDVYLINNNSATSQIISLSKGQVNSYHHQGIDKLAKDLIVTVMANDSLPEAIEWKDMKSRSFLMAVQWHPERLDRNNNYSKPFAVEFIKQIRLYNLIMKKSS